MPNTVTEVIGALGLAVSVNGSGRQARLAGNLSSANALVILRRCAVVERATELLKEPALAWAVTTNLGQGGRSAGPARATGADPARGSGADPARLLAAVHRRRCAALRSLGGAGLTVAAVRLVPDPVLVTGTGEASLQEVGIALHGTYGWPVLRGSTLKGVAHAYARDHCEPPLPQKHRERLFGTPRPGEDSGQPGDGPSSDNDTAARGEVIFLDALPYQPLPVSQHVLTPHVKDYYEDTGSSLRTKPPAEYYNPVPVVFLAVEGERLDGGIRRECGFLVTLAGTADAVADARTLLCEAAAEIGVGAKTAAGYGYLREGGSGS